MRDPRDVYEENAAALNQMEDQHRPIDTILQAKAALITVPQGIRHMGFNFPNDDLSRPHPIRGHRLHWVQFDEASFDWKPAPHQKTNRAKNKAARKARRINR